MYVVEIYVRTPILHTSIISCLPAYCVLLLLKFHVEFVAFMIQYMTIVKT